MPARSGPFDSPYTHGFVRVAAAVPTVAIADPAANAAAMLPLVRRAAERGAALVVFPELSITGYTCDDLFHQDTLLSAAETAIADLAEATKGLVPVVLVGAPLRQDGLVFNCAVALHGGRVIGVVPKTYLPNYREFYEGRHFAAAGDARGPSITVGGTAVPFGNDLLFEASGLPGFVFHAEICEDLWVPAPPSTAAALAGALVLVNLSASNSIVGKADYRRLICAAQSGRCVSAYVYTGAGFGESTTDLAWDGHALIYENGEMLAESERFSHSPQVLVADLDLEKLALERARLTTWRDCAVAEGARRPPLRRVAFDFTPPSGALRLERRVARFPYVPSDPATLDARCHDVYNIQVSGLAQRLNATGIKKVVIGISGGLDSTQAAIVACKAFDRLGLPRRNILCYTMPGFATSDGTRAIAWQLMRAFGVSAAEIDIKPSAQQMLADLGHPAAAGKDVFDITYENVQAGERTSHLFRLANMHDGIVIGTGDLSELALGFATYGVGDHMAHYSVNASVPKTLIQHLIRWAIHTHQFDAATEAALDAVLATEISPELVPGQKIQRTEDTVGPYALQDFHLYYLSRFGFRPSKIAYLAHTAWGDAASGSWPETIPQAARIAYDLPTIKHWLRGFLVRFFRNQFKRSAIPNAPKVGSGGSLSPRGDWRMPSDAPPTAWLAELDRNVP